MNYVTIQADNDSLEKIAEEFPLCEITLAVDENSDKSFEDFIERLQQEDIQVDEWTTETV